MRYLPLLLLLAVSLPARADLSGVYAVRQDVQPDRVFLDLLVFDEAALKGSLTVPGTFTARLLDVSVYAGELKFAIKATENGTTFGVQYVATIDRTDPEQPVLRGKATLENGEALGDFTARRIQRGLEPPAR